MEAMGEASGAVDVGELVTASVGESLAKWKARVHASDYVADAAVSFLRKVGEIELATTTKAKGIIGKGFVGRSGRGFGSVFGSAFKCR